MNINFNNYNPKDHYFSLEETDVNLHIKAVQKPKERAPGQAKIALMKIKAHTESKTLGLAPPFNILAVAQKIFEGYEAKRGLIGRTWDRFLELFHVKTERSELEKIICDMKQLTRPQAVAYINHAERAQYHKNLVDIKEITLVLIETIKDLQNYHTSYNYEKTLKSLSTIDPNWNSSQIEESLVDILSKSNFTHLEELPYRIKNEKVKNICILAQIYMDIETAKTFFRNDNSSKESLLSKSIKKFIEIGKVDKAMEIVDFLPFGKEYWLGKIMEAAKEKNQLDKVIEAAQSISYEETKWPLRSLFEKLIKEESLDMALKVANSMQDKDDKTYSLRQLCITFITNNSLDKAIEVANFLPNASEKMETLKYLLELKTKQA